MNYNLKKIEEIESFFNHLNRLRLVDYQHNVSLGWKEFLIYFFTNLNKEYYSISADQYINLNAKDFNEKLVPVQDFCLKNKNRSLLDIYRIVKYYYPSIRLYQVMGWLYSKLQSESLIDKIKNENNFFIGVLVCKDINKKVFHNLERYGSHNLYYQTYNVLNRTICEICDENGFYYKHYRAAYLKYIKEQ